MKSTRFLPLTFLLVIVCSNVLADWKTDTISFGPAEDRLSNTSTNIAIGPDNTYHMVFVQVYFDYDDIDFSHKNIMSKEDDDDDGDDDDSISDPFNIYYTYKEPGEEWSTPELIGENDRHNNAANIAVTEDGEVFIAFMRKGEADYWKDEIIVAEKTETGWVYEEVPTICESVNWYPYMVADPAGNLHISWVSLEEGQYYHDDENDYRIAYSTNLSGEWKTQLIRESELGSFGLGGRPVIDVCSEGVVHMLYRGIDYIYKDQQEHENIPGRVKEHTKGYQQAGNVSEEHTYRNIQNDHYQDDRKYAVYRMFYATNLTPGGTDWEIENFESDKIYDDQGTIVYDRETDRIHVLIGGSNSWDLPNYVYYASKDAHEEEWSDLIQVNQHGYGNVLDILIDDDKIYAVYIEMGLQFSSGRVYINELQDDTFHEREFFYDKFLISSFITMDNMGKILFPYSKFRIVEVDDDGYITDFTSDILMRRMREHEYTNPNPTSTADIPHFENLSVYPNPASERITIHFDTFDTRKAEINLYSLQGSKMLSRTNLALHPGRNEINIQIGHLPAGVYFLQLETGNYTKTGKVIIH